MQIYFKQGAIYHLVRIIITHFTIRRRIFRLYNIFPLYESDYKRLLQEYPKNKNFLKSKSIVIPDSTRSNKYQQLFLKLYTNTALKKPTTLEPNLLKKMDLYTELKEIINIPNKKIELSSTYKAKLVSIIMNAYIILKDIFPSNLNIQKVNVIPTFYGASVGFNDKVKDSNDTLYIYIREKIPLTVITEDIVRAILHPLLHNIQLNASQRQTVEQIILKYSKIAPIIKVNANNTYTVNSKLLEQIFKYSQKVLKDYNVSITPQDIYIDDKTLYVYGKFTNIKLSPTETILLQFLITNRDQLVNYYQIGDLLWPQEPNKFSMWAISQLIHKIRYKLHKAHFPEYKLKNIKGKGYVLVR